MGLKIYPHKLRIGENGKPGFAIFGNLVKVNKKYIMILLNMEQAQKDF
jgi:hypothetical protein